MWEVCHESRYLVDCLAADKKRLASEFDHFILYVTSIFFCCPMKQWRSQGGGGTGGTCPSPHRMSGGPLGRHFNVFSAKFYKK